MFRLDVLKIPAGMSEKKVINPTANMIATVLENTSLKTGVWQLKSPHRTRKKSDEKFRALRLDGPNGIRIRCKPGGNDTCFEYTLVPPVMVDTNGVFSTLLRVHPKNLKIPAGWSLIKAMCDVADGVPPKVGFVPEKHSVLEGGNENLPAPFPEVDTPEINSSDLTEEIVSSPREIAKELNNSLTTISSLSISPSEIVENGMLLSDPYVLDRALIAISTAVDGFGGIKKHKASDAVIENLKIKEFVDADQDQYETIAGAMRAIMMALSKNNYIDRIGSAHSTSGYQLTAKGRDRINGLKNFLSNEIKNSIKINEDKEEEIKQEIEPDEVEEHIVEENASISDGGDLILNNIKNKVDLIQGLIKDHEHHEEIQKEYKNILEDLEKEKETINMTLIGVNTAIEQKIKQKEDMEKEIERLKNKEIELVEEVRKRNSEISDWRVELESHEKESERIKREIKMSLEMTGESK